MGCLLVIVALFPAVALGQAADPAPADPAPAAAAEPAGGYDSGDDLEKLLRDLSPEEMQQLIASAVKSRLEVERSQVIEEMKEDLLLDPLDIEKAVKILHDNPANTQQDNIDRIIKALAVVDPRFSKAARLLGEGKAAEAAEVIEKDLNVQEATYRSAARYTLYARALAAQDKSYDAIEAYQKIMVVMGDRISFAAAAAIESAALYEKKRRFSYAAQMYAYAVDNYGLTLDEKVVKMIADKADEYAEFSGNPLGWAGQQMGEVGKSLGKGETGKPTQDKQEKIIAVLEDMIKTAEEQQQASSSGQGQQRQRQQQPGEGEGEGQGQGQGQGQRPQGTNQQPTSGANVSALVPGSGGRPNRQSQTHDTGETGDWSTLPPRERQRIEQVRSQIMSERYRELISKYRAKVAEEGGR